MPLATTNGVEAGGSVKFKITGGSKRDLMETGIDRFH